MVKQMIDCGMIKAELQRYPEENWQEFRYIDLGLRRILSDAALACIKQGRRIVDEKSGREVPNKHYRIAHVVYFTTELGLRTGEFLRMKMKNDGVHNYVDLENGQLFFRFGMHKSGAKNFEDGRRAFLNPQVTKVLRMIPENQEFLIEPLMRADTCYSQFRAFVKSIDVSHLSPQEQEIFKSIRPRDLRISLATDLTNKAIIKAMRNKNDEGKSLSMIAEHLGHQVKTLLDFYNARVGKFDCDDLDIFNNSDPAGEQDGDPDDDPPPSAAVVG